LVSKPELNDLARRIFEDLRGRGFYTTYDESDSIGRRYARVDEVGVPYAITVDFDSLDDNSVTLRERDSTKQVRIKIEDVPRVLKDLISGEKGFKNLLSSGKPFS
jgi:glycyl-tRNA synthetase